jgi:acyl dehydratase
MPLTINKDVLGKEYPPFVVTVERGRIKDFARAIGDPNPFYLDDAVGAASEWGDVIAPPTFATSFRDEAADSTALLRDLGVDIGRVLHGEQEFEIFREVRAGETLLCRTRIVDVYDKAGRSGPMAFVVRETAVTDRTNELVLTMRHTTVVRL